MLRVATATILFAACPAMAQSPAACTPIKFAPHASSAIVSGTVGSEPPFPCYTLTTGNGQIAALKFVKTNRNMFFTIDGVVDDRDAYTFKTVARTYSFSVFQNLRSTPDPFSLMVSVK